MNLAELCAVLPETGQEGPAFPQRLLGAFRRRSITFCTGETDEQTLVYWFQSRTFTIDLRLPDGAATPVEERQGWIGDTLWDEREQEMRWRVSQSYQPRNQWPEPASFRFIGNSVIEFAPSGAYVEDWRQQATSGPLLGLRLLDLHDETTGRTLPKEGGLIVVGEQLAYAQSRLPEVDEALRGVNCLGRALADGLVTSEQAESYEVSVSTGDGIVAHSTRPGRVGAPMVAGDFAVQPDGSIILSQGVDGARRRLRFALDACLRGIVFDPRTSAKVEALEWMEREKRHLARHAVIVR